MPLGLLARHHVDLALWGHLHAYERTLPMVNASLAATGASYDNAGGTPHVMIGMAGDGFCCGGWSEAPPRWSAFREDSFGYARVHVESDTKLRLEYVRNGDGGHGVRDQFTITKDAVSALSVAPWQLQGSANRPGEAAQQPPQPRHSQLGHRGSSGCPESRAP